MSQITQGSRGAEAESTNHRRDWRQGQMKGRSHKKEDETVQEVSQSVKETLEI